MLGGLDPFRRLRPKLINGHAGEGRHGDLLEFLEGEFRDRLAVAGQDGFEGFDLLQMRLRLHRRGDAVQAIDHLRIDRMLNPGRSVLVESGDARVWRHEIGACRV